MVDANHGFRYVHHVHYLVSDLDSTIDFMRRTFGMEPEARSPDPEAEAHARRESIREVHYRVGPTLIEMTQPLEPDSKYGRRLAEKGPHVLHVAWAVDDLDGLSADLRTRGVGHRFEASPRGGYRTINVDLDAAGGTHFQLAEDQGTDPARPPT